MTDAAMSRDGTHYVIRDYLRAYLYDSPVSAASLTSPTPGDQALLVAGEKDTALWWVPLTAASSSPSVTSSPGTSSAPTGTTSPSASGSGAAGAEPVGPGPLGVVAAVGALVVGAVVVVVAARRMRA